MTEEAVRRFVEGAESVLGEIAAPPGSVPAGRTLVVPGPEAAAKIYAAWAGEPEFVPPPPPLRPNLELPPAAENLLANLRWLAKILPPGGKASAIANTLVLWEYRTGPITFLPDDVRIEAGGAAAEARLVSEWAGNRPVWHEKIEISGG